jgi:hypothetical protein
MHSTDGPDPRHAAWLALRTDPAVTEVGETASEALLALVPDRTAGEPAFDQDTIAGIAERIETRPPVDTGHPLLDRSVRVGLAHTDATFRGDHPRYGVKRYAGQEHDGFPPTIVAAVDALSAWGLNERAAELFGYWLGRFVRADGTFDYYGPSLAEYGQVLHTARLLNDRAGPAAWWEQGERALSRIAGYLVRLHGEAQAGDGLLRGGPEADESDKPGRYFHNNAWVWRGLVSWAALCEQSGRATHEIPETAAALRADTLTAVERAWPDDPDDWWLPPRVEPLPRPESMTATRDASYTNYRYWPELLSSGLLPDEMANRLVDARLSAGGQFMGMTRFQGWLDDWPLADYLFGLWRLGRRREFLISLYGHILYHQAEGHLTAYEQVTFPPGREQAPYCLPCQLVAARAARLLVDG